MIRTQISYLPSNTNVKIDFPRWVFQYCGHTAIVLDVGAGNGRTGHAALIQQKVTRLVGVDPDMTIAQNPYLDEWHLTSLEEFAKDRDSCFDCLYTTSVLEHITHPREFILACRSLLKPGGMLFSITPNLWHYFGIATKLSSLLGIEDWLLERLIGAQAKNSYHFPTVYRLNSIRTIRHMLAYAGFQEVEFKLLDPPKAFTYCLPGGLHWFPSLYSELVYKLKVPQIMGLIMFRATA